MLVLYQIKLRDRIPTMGREALSSVWLVPTEKDAAPISQVIKDLAQRHDATPFLPHITVWGAVTAPLAVVEEASRDAVSGIKPFTVEVERLDYSEEWAKTLFTQIKPNETLDEIHRRLADRLRRYTDYILNPHMSLIYKTEMTEEEKLKEIPNISIPQSFTLDRIAITLPGDPVEKWENVALWSTPFLIRFGS